MINYQSQLGACRISEPSTVGCTVLMSRTFFLGNEAPTTWDEMCFFWEESILEI